ncbi:MAG: ATP-binding cassette domain-containing protein [Gemmatimonadetes bacterium]|nr:ATP-binding cassette domain-containing protein [Gemmatimonadota bacterium]MBT7858956.1 ATP-binding cassette domain-containing protein [Gemmatimonadota bacterium]
MWGYARPYRLRTALCSLATIVRALFMLILPLFYQEIFDGVLAPGGTSAQLARLIGMVVLAFIVIIGADLAMAWLGSDLAARIMGDIRRRMYLHLQMLSESFYSRVKMGDLMSRFTNDLFSVDWAVSISLVQTLFYSLLVTASVGLLFHFEWRLALATVVILPLTALGPKLLGRRAMIASSQRKHEEAEVAMVLQEDIAGHRVIQAFGLQGLFFSRFDDRLQRLRGAALHSNLSGAFLTKASDIGVIVVQLTIVSVGALLALRGDLSSGTLVGFLTVLISVGNSIKMLIQLVPDMIDGAAGMQRVNELLREEISGSESAGGDLERVRGRVCFSGVSFSYTGEELNLADLNLTIEPGESVAIVGPSGSGKSTVLDLLTRFYEAGEGQITIDGQDIQATSRERLRHHIGAVFQQSYLFNTSLRENIRQGRLDATDTEVEAAAQDAEIHDVILRLPQGYDTMPGEGGGQLSGGQRQRIALARAILRDPPILILDEATSALDPATEAAVNATLERLCVDRTTLSVTHRLSAAASMDRIFVLDQGRLVEEGRHKELLNLKGVYYQMWQEFGLELTGDALLGERAETMAEETAPVAPVELAAEFEDIDRAMQVGADELSHLIQQFQAEVQAEQQGAQRLRDVNQRWARVVGTDRLTGLPNRTAYLEAMVPREIEQAQRDGDPVGIVLLSPDNMGLINEQHGRNAGDAVIRELAKFLESITDGEEVLGHLDGSNFAISRYPASEAETLGRAEELRQAVDAHVFECVGAQIHLTISAGVAAIDTTTVTDARGSAEEIFHVLNDALYDAKKGGGDTAILATPESSDDTTDR